MEERTIHNFHHSLKSGEVGEREFLIRYCPFLVPYDGREADFKILDSPSKVELKTESYCLTGEHGKATTNLFLERYSDIEKESPGGPWQAREHCKYFISFFPCCRTYYFFKTKQLVRLLDKLIANKQVKPIRIPNRTGDHNWTTLGYPVPIELLESISQVYIF